MNKSTATKRKGRLTDRVMESLVYVSGGLVVLSIIAIAYFLTSESRFAFNQKFTYGFLFAAQPVDMDKSLPEYADISYDVTATTITAHAEGGEGLDEKEEVAPMPTLESMQGMNFTATGTVLGGNITQIGPDTLWKDDWREPAKAEKENRYVFFAFASPEYEQKAMTIAWDIQQGADPKLAPFDLRLRMIDSPDGVQINPIEIDLKNEPKGRIEIPTFIAKTDADRTKGYAFEVIAKPQTTSVWATLVNFFRTEWGPTLAHPRYGFIPLLISTLLITLIGLCVATPIGVASAIYLAESAPAKVREVLKPIIELLASVPTIVLGYFGLMLLAPAIQATIAKAAGLDSGRSLITAALMMGVLLVPIIMTLAEDSFRAVPMHLREGGIALGLTQSETLRKIVIPAAKSGIVAAVMLGMARAIGETMIVWVLSGGTPFMPSFASPKDALGNLARPSRGIPDTIGIEMGNVTFEEPHYGHLFLLGVVLFAITLLVNLAAFRYARKQAWRH